MTTQQVWSADRYLSAHRYRIRALALPALLAAAGVGAVATRLGTGTNGATALLLPLALVPVLLWFKPEIGVYAFFFGAVLIEQFDYRVGPHDGAVTARIPLFHSVTPGMGITPFEVLLGLSLLFLAMQRIRTGQPLIPRSTLSRRIGLLLLFVLAYFVFGLLRHGDSKIALWEVRPFVYVALLYVLSASLIKGKDAVRALMWCLVLGSAVKAVYGIVIWWSVRNLNPRPEAILGHEESFFFGLFICLVLGLWLFGMRGALRTVATVLSPVVLLADMCNSRRTAWAVLGLGVLFMMVAAYIALPERRKALRRCGLIALIVSAVYVPAFWNRDGTTAQPVRAARSEIAPSARDKESNQYRDAEDVILMLNIKQQHSLGSGYGIQINYSLPMVDLRTNNRLLSYVPHNGVLYVWMRLGILGALVFWFMIAEAFRLACRVARAVDREIALLGAFVGCALVAYVLMGDKDYGFFWFRIAVVMGILLGAAEANSRSAAASPRLRQMPQALAATRRRFPPQRTPEANK